MCISFCSIAADVLLARRRYSGSQLGKANRQRQAFVGKEKEGVTSLLDSVTGSLLMVRKALAERALRLRRHECWLESCHLSRNRDCQ